MIDAHIHVVPPRLPGVGPLSPLLEGPVATLAAELSRQMELAGIDRALAMGAVDSAEGDPLGVAGTLAVARRVPGVYAVGIANPARSDAQHLESVEAALATGEVRALKAYLGYLHFGPDHDGYKPYYNLAARHGIPFIFHTGDTYSPRAKLKYAQPLGVDEVAVDFPTVRFVLAHLGNPWLQDAAEVVYKNVNVWADLSGLVVGPESAFGEEHHDALQDLAARLRQAFRYAERPNRFLYGSDWPLAPMAAYRNFIRHVIPEVFHSLVFEENARGLFRI